MNNMLNWKISSEIVHPFNLSDFKETLNSYLGILNSEQIGFFRLPSNEESIKDTKSLYEKFKSKKNFLHLGIGGSSLGPEMLISALGKKNTETQFTFINNIDPDDLFYKIKNLDLKQTLIYVVSKSGTTAETVAAVSILIDQLHSMGIKEENYKDYFVFCTDPDKGDLRDISKKYNISTLCIPSNIGGRFSVLTPVGLFPAPFAGISVEDLLKGALSIQHKLSHPNEGEDFFKLALWLKTLHDQGINQTVIMPYSSLLKDFSAWFVQLWAESLGKEGKGLTPIPSYGATDQHSQMQLFMEGPNNKALLIVENEHFEHDFSLKNQIPAPSFVNLAPYSLGQLMKAELEGTLAALKENKRHLVHFKIPSLNEASLGQLIMLSESLTVLMGILLKVDPFNQPGVEAGKKYAYSWLKNGKI